MKLLIVDDDHVSRTMLAALAKKWGYDPVCACDGEEAWEILMQADPPRLLVIDRMMPRLDGIALCRRVRSFESVNNPSYIVLLTAMTQGSDVAHGLESGANDYVRKPFDKEELHARLSVGQRMLELQDQLNLLNAQLEYQALHDSLTGVLNRGAVINLMEREYARTRRSGELLCAAMLDIDHFKQVNDTYGHIAGDAILVDMCQRVKSCLRLYDILGRYGGEEFLLLFHCREESDALELCHRINESISSTPFLYGEFEIPLTVSIGLCTVRNIGVDELLSRADHALYRAKSEGRNRTVLSTEK